MNIRRFLPHFFALSGFVALAGCVSVGPPGIPLAQRAPLKGRAFRVGTITFAKGVVPKGSASLHCLPDAMYAKMLRHEMQIGFKHAHLGQGRGPAVPVSLVITKRQFGTNIVSGTYIVGNVHIGGVVGKHLYIEDGAYYKDWNTGPDWTLEQHIIPTVALAMANGTKAIQQGKNFDQQGEALLGGDWASYWAHPDIPKDGLKGRMTTKQIEADTGKSKAQLAAICQADIRAGN